MPENETLVYDSRTASRWRSLGERLDGGLVVAEAFPTIEDQFYRGLQKVWRQWKNRGVDPAKLFSAALNDPTLLRELIRQTSFDPNARLLRDVVADLPNPDMKSLVVRFLDAAWESAQYQLELDRRDEALPSEFRDQVAQMLERIARCLLNNPSRFPSRIRNQPPPDIGKRLCESLL